MAWSVLYWRRTSFLDMTLWLICRCMILSLDDSKLKKHVMYVAEQSWQCKIMISGAGSCSSINCGVELNPERVLSESLVSHTRSTNYHNSTPIGEWLLVMFVLIDPSLSETLI